MRLIAELLTVFERRIALFAIEEEVPNAPNNRIAPLSIPNRGS